MTKRRFSRTGGGQFDSIINNVALDNLYWREVIEESSPAAAWIVGSSDLYDAYVGTGVVMDRAVFAARPRTGSVTLEINNQLAAEADEQLPRLDDFSSKLTGIRTWLGLNLSQTAQVLNVQRPTIYKWLGGRVPRAANQKRITEIYELAEYWSHLDTRPMAADSRRQIQGDSSIVDMMSAPELDEVLLRTVMQQLAEFRQKQARQDTSFSAKLKRRGVTEPSDIQQRKSLNRLTSSVGFDED